MASTDVRTLVSLQELPRFSSLLEVFLIFSEVVFLSDLRIARCLCLQSTGCNPY